MVEVAKTTSSGSKPRHEFCQKAKAFAKFADLPGIKKLEKVHTKYVAKVPKLPTDEELFAFAEKHRHDGRFCWRFAALVVYGCRVCEVYSLVSTGDGGTASVLTLKQKGIDPKPRTAISLPFDLVERLDLLNVQKPFEISDGEDYDSDAAKSQTATCSTSGFRSHGTEAPSSRTRMFGIAVASARSTIQSSAMD